jgi:hypothetical protein
MWESVKLSNTTWPSPCSTTIITLRTLPLQRQFHQHNCQGHEPSTSSVPDLGSQIQSRPSLYDYRLVQFLRNEGDHQVASSLGQSECCRRSWQAGRLRHHGTTDTGRAADETGNLNRLDFSARLAQAGFLTRMLSGDTPAAERETIISDCQKDDSHMSDPIAYITGDNAGVLWNPQPCRILIITSVCTTGIDLSRANHMIMVDQLFTHQEFVQAHGLIVRKGQKQRCTIDIIIVEKTCDDRPAVIPGSKGGAEISLVWSR